jgi:predicted amidohydrolase
VQFSGGSCIVDSHGNVLASCDSGDRILSAELQLPEENPQLKSVGLSCTSV